MLTIAHARVNRITVKLVNWREISLLFWIVAVQIASLAVSIGKRKNRTFIQLSGP